LESIGRKVGKIDVFISNAGGVPESGLLADLGTEALVRSFQDNVLTAFNAIRAFLPLAGRDAILLSTNTCMAHFAPIPGSGPYSLSRAAALKMTDFFAAENPQLHVVSVQPGWVPTDMNGHQTEATDVGKTSNSISGQNDDAKCTDNQQRSSRGSFTFGLHHLRPGF
jgi:NAD(P)-dependent dehydrogenase (short-subunit alcohol dehydrogenase family)